MSANIRVTIWNEFRHEKSNEDVKKIYPDGMHKVIGDFLGTAGNCDIRSATLDEPEHGLTEEVLNNTDVLLWWGHMAHGEVSDSIVDRSSKEFSRGWVLSFSIQHTFQRYSSESLVQIALSAGAKSPKRKGFGI